MDEYEEIDLREYIKVLLKRKWIVISVTLASVVGAGVVSFFILKPVYQAKAVLLVPKFTTPVVSKSMTIEEYINLQTLTPLAFSPETYIGLLKSPALGKKVVNTLDLKKPSGEQLFPDELEGMMVAEPIKNTNLIEIRVQHYNPKKAAKIANVWARLFVEENKRSSIQETISSEKIIREQFEIAKRKLEEAEEEKKAFEEKSKIPILEKQVSNKINKIAEFDMRVSDIDWSLQKTEAEIRIWLPTLIESEISAYESRLADIRLARLTQGLETEEIKEELADQTETLILRKSIIEDPYLNEVLAELTGRDAISLSRLGLESEQINPIYQGLKQRLVNLNISRNVSEEEAAKLEITIAKFKKILSNLRQKLSNNGLEYQQLILIVNSTLSKLREVQLGRFRSPLAKELERKLVDATVSIQSLLEERKQVNENIKKHSKELDELRAMLKAEKLMLTNLERNLSIAKSTYDMLSQKLGEVRIASPMKTGGVKIACGVLGLFVGTLAAFFIEWWEKDEEKGKKEDSN